MKKLDTSQLSQNFYILHNRSPLFMLILSVSFVVFQVSVTRRTLGFLQVSEHKIKHENNFFGGQIL